MMGGYRNKKFFLVKLVYRAIKPYLNVLLLFDTLKGIFIIFIIILTCLI